MWQRDHRVDCTGAVAGEYGLACGTAGLETRAVDMHVARLRAKLRSPDGGDDQAEAIVTVRAHGYMAGPALSVPSPNGKDGK